MKNVLYLFVLTLFLFSFCSHAGSGNKEEQSTSGSEVTVTEEMTETENGETEAVEIEKDKIKNCDEFLDKYEAWVNEYLNLLEKFKKNPADPQITQKYLDLTQELSSWSEQWIRFVDCSNSKKYEKRFDVISDKVDKKLKELGYE